MRLNFLDEMFNEARDNVGTWLEEENIQQNVVQDNDNDYHLRFWYSRGLQLDTVFKNDKIIISVTKQFSPAIINYIN